MAKGSRLTSCLCCLILAGIAILGVFVCVSQSSPHVCPWSRAHAICFAPTKRTNPSPGDCDASIRPLHTLPADDSVAYAFADAMCTM